MKTAFEMIEEKTETRVCDTHGEYLSKSFVGNHWSMCPRCADEIRAKREAEQAVREASRKAEEERLRLEQRLSSSLIPPRFADKTLENYAVKNKGQADALAFATAYAEDFKEVFRTGRSAIFTGRPGTGKTHLAIGIAHDVMRNHNATALFTTVSRLIRTVRDSWNTPGARESDAIDIFTTPALLIVDEVGVQYGSQSEKNILFDILNDRYEHAMPCLLLSNLPVRELVQYIGERIYDRLRESGGTTIPFDWGSERSVA